MPAWNEARRAGQSARASVQADRTAPGASISRLPQAKERFEKRLCVYCGEKATGRRVGNLVITGPVIFCKRHAKRYEDDKAWEAARKKELGL